MRTTASDGRKPFGSFHVLSSAFGLVVGVAVFFFFWLFERLTGRPRSRMEVSDRFLLCPLTVFLSGEAVEGRVKMSLVGADTCPGRVRRFDIDDECRIGHGFDGVLGVLGVFAEVCIGDGFGGTSGLTSKGLPSC